jgi:hypothetical protein
MFEELVTLGLRPRPWDTDANPTPVGTTKLFTARFDPGSWHPDYPHIPFLAADRFDMYWGAKIVASFTRPQLEAAVSAGRFSDPRAVAYLVDTLVARQRLTEDYWFQRVNPLDSFAVRSTGALCFDDLAIEVALAPAAQTRYRVTTHDAAGRTIGRPVELVTTGVRTCTPPIEVAEDNNGYTVVELTTLRPGFRASTFVHLAPRAAPRSRLHVIGIWRT